MAHRTTLITLTLFFGLSRAAETSLYFPGFDPQPLSVDFISTDSQGHTVWAVHGTQDAAGDGGFPGVMTLVEGSSYASIGYTFPQLTITLDEECGLAANTAVCAVTSNGAVLTTTDTAVTLLAAELGTTPPQAAQSTSGPTSTSLQASATSTSGSTSAPGSAVSGVAPATSLSSASATSTSKANSALRGKSAIGFGLGNAILSFIAVISFYVTL